MKTETEKTISDQSPKLRRSKSREVSSRFLYPASNEGEIPSPNQTLSPIGKKIGSTTTDVRKHRSVEDIGLIRRLWPSSNSSSSSTSQSSTLSKKLDTLADHLGNERLKDFIERKNNERSTINGSQFLNRQTSCSEFNRFEKEKDNSKENHRPIGGSMRYTGKLRFPGKGSSSCNSSLAPGRLSDDENAQNQISSRRNSDSFADILSSESECSEIFSSTDISSPAVGKSTSFSSSNSSYLSSTTSSRRSGIKISSRYLHDPSSKSRRGTSDSNIPTPVTSENSPNLNNLPRKNAIKRGNSMTAYGTTISQWALSPGRSGSPPISVENKGKPVESFSSLKPPSSPSRHKGVGNLLSLGLELFKSKKFSSNCSSSWVGQGIGENVHLLRLLHNRLIQWRFMNARAATVSQKKITQAERNLLSGWATLSKLQSSVVQKRIQFEKEKLELKLNAILHSQVKPLEAWGDMERQHLLAVSMTKDCLHSVVCRVPLIEGAKVDPQSASVALRQATDLTAAIKTMLIDFSPAGQKMGSLLSELAEVVSREKSSLEECFELLEIVSALEIEERSLKCSIVQLRAQHEQLQQKQGIVA